MIIVYIWLVIIALMLMAGIVFRLAPRQLPAVRLQKVAPAAAAQLVGEFIESSYDGEFGYPSGRFQVERRTEQEVVAREYVARGSHFIQIFVGLYKGIFRLGGLFGCIGAIIAIPIAIFLTPALIYAAVAETLLKYLLRSRIVTSLKGDEDSTEAAFTLRGPVALLVGRRLERAFNAPVLPARIATLAGISATAGTPASAVAHAGQVPAPAGVPAIPEPGGNQPSPSAP
jgi:hypothetical protein